MEDTPQVNRYLDKAQVEKRIKLVNESREIILSFLEQINYWLTRFEASRDINDLDNAERNAEGARLYLPLCFQELSLIGLQNMYWSLSAKQASDERGF